MRVIKYNDSSQALRLEFPSTWIQPTSVSITIYDRSGEKLLTATAATMGFSPCTIADGTTPQAGDTTITLSLDVSLKAGDIIRVSKDGERTEDLEVLAYDSSTAVVTLRRPLEFDHEGSDVAPRWCTYALDTSTTTTWEAGREVTLEWTPDTDDPPMVEYGRVEKQQIASADLQPMFAAQYPTRYTAIKTRWEEFEALALERLRIDMLYYGRKLNDLVETSVIRPLLIELIALLAVADGGDAAAEEIHTSREAYHSQLEKFCATPLFWDLDQDKVRDAYDWDMVSPRTFERRF